MRGGVPIALVIGVNKLRQTEQHEKSAATIVVAKSCGPQNQAKKIFCLFIRDTVFFKRLSYAVGLMVYSLIILVQSPAQAADGVSIAWNPSSNTNVVGYNVYYGGSSGVYTNKIYVGNVTSAVVMGLTPDATYYFSATSVSASGEESGYSAEISYTVPNPVVLAMNTTRTGGVVTAISLTASGDIPAQWTIESSTDLQTWTPMASGTNSAVNVLLPVTGLPRQFFRLVNE
jgi:hypothetical protein